LATFIEMPDNFNFPNTVEFCRKLESLTSDFEYVIDYGKMKNVEPFGMLLIGSTIRKMIANNDGANFHAINYTNNDYAAHMGFYQSIGLDYGKAPGEAKGSNTYLPITQLKIQDIREESRFSREHIVDTVERRAHDIATVLSRENKNLKEVLTYSIREIMRNVIEHSEADSIWYAGQYWPSKDRVEIAILDEGIGVYKSLKRNRKLKIKDNGDALLLSVEPGISGKDIRLERKRDEIYGNTGYGLYMTSRICEDGGDFLIGSGDRILGISRIGSKLFNTATFNGTVIRMRIKPSRIETLEKHLTRYLKEGEERIRTHRKSEVISASQSSRLLLLNKNDD